MEAEWTSADVIRFIEKVEHILNLLSHKNVEFISTNYLDVKKTVVTKQITLYYKINGETLELLRFWNTYRDLKTLNYTNKSFMPWLPKLQDLRQKTYYDCTHKKIHYKIRNGSLFSNKNGGLQARFRRKYKSCKS